MPLWKRLKRPESPNLIRIVPDDEQESKCNKRVRESLGDKEED